MISHTDRHTHTHTHTHSDREIDIMTTAARLSYFNVTLLYFTLILIFTTGNVKANQRLITDGYFQKVWIVM